MNSVNTDSIVIRPVRGDDAEQLLGLAELLDTMNLPRDRDAIEGLIATSEAAFARMSSKDQEAVPTSYTLVADSGDKLLGTASLLSHHGTPEDPHYYLTVGEHLVHSEQLHTERKRHVLKLEYDEQPWTELGGLIVHPDARGRGLGKLLLASRLLLVKMFPRSFCERLLAEMLPDRRENGGNAFWDALGGQLTGLHFYRADLLCRSDKEFIDKLFPKHEIVLELLPPEAQAIVGKVGANTVPARRMLERIGFQYLHAIDPFDGGPHLGAKTCDVDPLKRARSVVCLDYPPQSTDKPLLLGNPDTHRFVAATCQTHDHGVRLDDETKAILGRDAGNLLYTMPLDW